MKLIEVRLDRMIPVSVQSPGRTTPKAVKALAAGAAHSGIFLPPIVRPTHKDGWFELIDGTRRKTVAEAKGVKTLLCLLLEPGDTDLSSAALFALFGDPAVTRTQRGCDWAGGWARKGDDYLKDMPKTHADNIRDLYSIVGKEEARRLCMNGECGPSISRQMRQLERFLDNYKGSGLARPARKIGLWLLRHKQASVVYSTLRAVRQGLLRPLPLARKFVKAIDADRPLNDDARPRKTSSKAQTQAQA